MSVFALDWCGPWVGHDLVTAGDQAEGEKCPPHTASYVLSAPHFTPCEMNNTMNDLHIMFSGFVALGRDDMEPLWRAEGKDSDTHPTHLTAACHTRAHKHTNTLPCICIAMTYTPVPSPSSEKLASILCTGFIYTAQDTWHCT